MTPDRRTLRIFSLALITALCGGWLQAAEPIETDTHRLTEVRNGIYLAQTTAQVFNSNAIVIVNEDDVVLIDSHITPAKARDLVASIGVLTDKPISALINSHFHFDHAHGNQIFNGIPIIGHEFTRMKMAGAPLEEPTWVSSTAGNQAQLKQLEEQIAAAQGDEKFELEAYLEMFAAHVKDFDEVDPVAPDVTIREKMTLHRGSREMEILFLGRAHTGGDVFVYFPQDKLLYTGDAAFAGPSFLGDGYVDEWPDTLMNIKELDFDIFVPGHGPPVEDLSRIDIVADYYRDLWKQTAGQHGSGVSAEDASKTIDLTSHTKIPVMEVGANLQAVQRMYHRLDNPDAP